MLTWKIPQDILKVKSEMQDIVYDIIKQKTSIAESLFERKGLSAIRDQVLGHELWTTSSSVRRRLSAILESRSSFHTLCFGEERCNVILKEFAFATNKGGSSVVGATFIRKKYLLSTFDWLQAAILKVHAPTWQDAVVSSGLQLEAWMLI